MKKRLAKKAMSGRYFNIWTKPGVDTLLTVPRNGRCWNIFLRACDYYGHPEWAEDLSQIILDTLYGNNDTEDK